MRKKVAKVLRRGSRSHAHYKQLKKMWNAIPKPERGKEMKVLK